MKRIAGLLLAAVILVGVVFAGSFSVFAASSFTASDECIRILKAEEGFSVKPYWDFTQWTVGYGTKCPDDMLAYYNENGISEADAEVLLRNHLAYVESDLNKFADKYGLTWQQNQFDAMLLFSYNCGSGWTYDATQNIHKAIAGGATGNDLIYWLGRWCRAGGEVKDYLLRRRLSEANMYLNAVYSQTPPENYCYVLYNANGGTADSSAQAYDSALTAQIVPGATYSGYTFDGWYTERTGGTKVTVLDASTKGKTLYAHWLGTDGQAPENGAALNVTITVTGTDVSLRNGPGTNYARVGFAQKGDQKVITETAEGTGYTWGKFDGGWIALKFTNFDQVMKEQEANKPSAPEQTVPETTQPADPVPETTAPAPTVPEETKPQGPAKVTGTVKVSDYLCVRSGPGTGYGVAATLKNGTKVEILEQKTVGHMVWGKISNGWISLSYVTLDKQETNDSSNTATPSTPAAQKGTVKAVGGLRVRTGPGVSHSVAGYLDNGSKVEITETQTVGSTTWGKTAKGWVSMDYIVLDAQSNTGNTGSTGETTTTQTVTGTVKVSDYLRVRTGPGTSYAVATYLTNGTKVEITEQKTVGATVWGKTAQGWVSMDYIVVASQNGTATQKVTKTVTADCLRVRSSAGTSSSIVGYLYYGAKVEILETTTVGGTTWGRVSNGWISMDYTK